MTSGAAGADLGIRPRNGVSAAGSKTEMSQLRSVVDAILNRHAVVGLALGVVRDGKLDFFNAHGVADIATGKPITQDTIFRIASITKTFTAVAVMQLAEGGLVDLDAPANSYLRAFKLVPARAGLRQPTVRHLLTHTAGLPETVRPSRLLSYIFVETYGLHERVPPLADYYRGQLRFNFQPGTRFAYTDHSFGTLGQIVEDVTREPLDRYMRERIFEPLGMTGTDLGRSDRVRSRLATGYTFGSKGPKPVTDRQPIAAAATSIYSSPKDMALYLAALMGGGANEHGSILEPATLAMMYAPQFQLHPDIPGIGLAFSRVNLGGHRAIEHGGILPGFNSQIFVAPDDHVGVMAFTNGGRQAMLWLPGEISHVLSRILGAREDAIRTDIPQHPEIWSELCGWYPISAPLTETRLRSMLGLGVQVYTRRGRLMLRPLAPVPAALRGFVLHPDAADDPYVFRIDLNEFGIGTGRVMFTREPGGAIRAHFDLLPLSLVKGVPRVRPSRPGPTTDCL